MLHVITYFKTTRVVVGHSVLTFASGLDATAPAFAGALRSEEGPSAAAVVTLSVPGEYFLRLFRTELEANLFVADFRRFVFDSAAVKFVFRPWISIETEYKETTADHYVKLPLGVDVPLTVVYNDPDQQGFDQQYQYVKCKDRYDFCALRAAAGADLGALTVKRDQPAVVVVSSTVPGVAKIRAKDNLFLCHYVALRCKFSPNVAKL